MAGFSVSLSIIKEIGSILGTKAVGLSGFFAFGICVFALESGYVVFLDNFADFA